MFSIIALFLFGLGPSVAVAEDLPMFALKCNSAVGPCNNACYAVNHGFFPGILTKAAPRAYDNRKRSGCTSDPCGHTHFGDTGAACAAYPFAGTAQGGTGSILRCVQPDQNLATAKQLGEFYKGKKDGARFQVAVYRYRNAAFCRTVAKQNNGSEFRRSGGKFVSAPNAPTSAMREMLSSNSTVSRRFFKAQNGEVVMLLSNGEGENFVGKKVFLEDEGEIPIVEELPQDYDEDFDDEE